MKTIAIIGAACHSGLCIVEQLSRCSWVDSIIAIDREMPESLDPRIISYAIHPGHPLLADILQSHHVDTVVHLTALRSHSPGSIEHIGDADVVAVINLLNACHLAGIPEVIVLSPGYVYGAEASGPHYVREDCRSRARKSDAALRTHLEIERLFDTFIASNPATTMCILRPAPVIDTTLDASLTSLLRHRMIITVLGFDPLMQLLHPLDLTTALMTAIENPGQGTFHLAAKNCMTMLHLIHSARGVSLPFPGPLASLLVDGLYQTGLYPIPAAMLDFFRFNCLLNTNKAANQLGFSPRYRTEEALLYAPYATSSATTAPDPNGDQIKSGLWLDSTISPMPSREPLLDSISRYLS